MMMRTINVNVRPRRKKENTREINLFFFTLPIRKIVVLGNKSSKVRKSSVSLSKVKPPLEKFFFLVINSGSFRGVLWK